MYEEAIHLQNTIVDLLDEAYDGRLEYAQTYLKEYCPDYVRAYKAYVLLGEDLYDTLSEHGKLPFEKCCSIKKKLLDFSSWHCFLSGRIAALEGVRSGYFIDPKKSTKSNLFELEKLYVSMEYSHYHMQLTINEEKYLKLANHQQKTIFRQFLDSLDKIYDHIWAMMYIMGLDTLLEATDLSPTNWRMILQQSDKLRKYFAIG